MVYRAITYDDAKSLAIGGGILAKNPTGSWGLLEHFINNDESLAQANDLWIATTRSLQIAEDFNKRNNLGIVAIDLNKVTSEIRYPAIEFAYHSTLDEEIAFDLATYEQEVSIFGYVNPDAIVGFVK